MLNQHSVTPDVNHTKKFLTPYAAFLLFNMFFFMMDSVHDYLSIYLNGIGITKTAIGTITGTGSLAVLLLQPFIGALTDGARSKNRVLQLFILISALLYPLILLNKSFLFILVVHTIYAVFRSPQHSINTSMAVEYAERSGKPYGQIRMMGSLGYMIMMYVISKTAGEPNGRVGNTFLLFCCAGLLNVLLIWILPTIKGQNRKSEGKKVPVYVLLKSKPFVLLMTFHILFSVSTSLCRNYFPIYFTDDMGGTNSLYGLMLSISALIELPFLFYADKLLKRFGPKRLLFTLGILTASRWFGAYWATNTTTLFVIQCGNMIGALETVIYSLLISKMALPQLKTSVQTLSATVQGLAGILIGSYLGGFLADILGLRSLFLISGISTTVVTVVFVCFILNFKQMEPAQIANPTKD